MHPYEPAAYTVSIRRVQAFAGLAMSRGWDIEAMLESAGISPTLLVDGRSRVTTEQAAQLLRQLWRATDDELFGFGLAPAPLGSFRLVCYALLTAPDLQAALQRFAEFNRLLPGFPPIQLTTGAGQARLSIDISAVQHPVDLLVDVLLVAVHRFIGWAIGRRVPLHRAEVPYTEPADVDDYDLIFGAPVRFSAAAPTLVFDTAILSATIVRDQDALDEFLRAAPVGLLGYRDDGIATSTQVRRILQRGLSGDWPSVDAVAAELAVSPQTLRRKLRDERTSVRKIREQILRDAAIASLVRGQETTAALSRRLGFSEPSAFSRAFRRWTGSPPGSYQP